MKTAENPQSFLKSGKQNVLFKGYLCYKIIFYYKVAFDG